ncbi:vWA domain-containing protein [Saccharomonospora marina]|nr:VWA domain-containing protein [Saccharomonospora marina]
MRLKRSAGVVMSAVLLCLLGTPVAFGQSEEPGSRYAPTMLVLDASGSMAEADADGVVKMDAAKQAVHAVVEAAPAGSRVGLAVYGTGTGNSDAERAKGCEDVLVLREPEPIEKSVMADAVDGLTPRGYTPIGKALRVAADRLPEQGPRAIVLVSDGEDTCAPPQPCEVVKELTADGIDLVVHTVGFAVEQQARSQLTCVAHTTGGTYTDAPDARTLEEILPRVTATALRNYEPAGVPIAGSQGYDSAPVAGPGQYLDTIGQRERRFYAVDVPEGATAYFSATVSFPRLSGISVTEDFSSLQLRTYGTDGEDCHEFETEQATRSSDGVALTVATTWQGAAEAETGSEQGDRCKGGGRYYFAVEWSRVASGVPERLPMELLVGVEAAVADTGPTAVRPKVEFVEPTGPAVPVTGGGSFNVAGVLTGSGSYTDTVQRGEFLFYRVKLDWGQGLAYRVRFGQTPGRGLPNLSNISTTLYAPSREQIDWDGTAYTGSANALPTHDPSIATVPVRYNNRTADEHSARSQSVAGWYYIAVKVSPPHEDDGTAHPVPVHIELTVGGEPEQGPRYRSGSPDSGGVGPFGDGGARLGGDAGQARAGVLTSSPTQATPSMLGWVVAAGLTGVAAAGTGLFFFLRRRGGPSAR